MQIATGTFGAVEWDQTPHLCSQFSQGKPLGFTSVAPSNDVRLGKARHLCDRVQKFPAMERMAGHPVKAHDFVIAFLVLVGCKSLCVSKEEKERALRRASFIDSRKSPESYPMFRSREIGLSLGRFHRPICGWLRFAKTESAPC